MSYKKAVYEMCKQCPSVAGNKGKWKERVTACQVTTCPLYGVRPKSRVVAPAAAG